MIPRVHIHNFKTLKDVVFPCTRVNLFLGDTNTGKSNILEALTLLARGSMRDGKWDTALVRYDDLEDLFPLRDLSEPMVVQVNGLKLEMRFDVGRFHALVSEKHAAPAKWKEVATSEFFADGRMNIHSGFQFKTPLRRYQFQADTKFGPNASKELEAPYGYNLPGLLASNKTLRSELSEVLKSTGLRLEVTLKEHTLRMSRLVDEHVVVVLPYRNLSDTIKRYLFMYAMLGTVKDCSLLLDEPEQNTFPFYTKHMAEMMALDNGNQYFITTHNEILFRSVVEKTAAKELSVFITHLDADGWTRLKRLSAAELSELLDGDIFFNLDRYLPA